MSCSSAALLQALVGKEQLVEKELFVGQSVARCRQAQVACGVVHGPHGLIPLRPLLRVAHGLGHPVAAVSGRVVQEQVNFCGKSAAVQLHGPQFFGRRIKGGQSAAAQGAACSPFDFGVSHIESLVECANAAKDNHFFALGQALLDPAQALEPDKVQLVGAVDQAGRQSPLGSGSHGLQPGKESAHLNLCRPRQQVANAQHHAAVDVAVGVVGQKVAKGPQAQVCRKGFCPQGTDSFEVGEGGVEPARGHTQK